MINGTSKVTDAIRHLIEGPESFSRAITDAMARARNEVAEMKRRAQSGDHTEEVVARYDAAMLALSDSAAQASLCRNSHPDQKMREAAETAEQQIDGLMTELSLDRGLYDALAAVDTTGFDKQSRYYVEKTLRDLRRAGVDRDEPTRQKVRALREELVRLGQEFGRNIVEDVRKLEVDTVDLDGLPDDFKQTHPARAHGKVVLSTDNTDYVPFITYARSSKAREALWRLYRLRGYPKNLEVLDRILARRYELATLLGYASWAAYATEDKMIGSAEKAADFIARITTASRARMARDFGELLTRKRKETPEAATVDAWDSAYLQDRVSAESYGFDSQEIRPYLEYSRVKAGVLEITAKMFGIRYQRVEGAPTWHEDVEVYDVLETSEDRLLGRIYLDMHPREGKYKHYAQFTVQTGRGEERLPEGALMCNFPRPQHGQGTKDPPALMEHDGVRTFFHEFGHLLHHVLGGHTRWAGQSGVATEWDFVEAPSQMLEEWVWDAPTMQTFAHHYETGEPVPAKLLEQARKADQYGKGLWVGQQMFYAGLSLELHARDPRGLDTNQLVAELQSRYTPFRYVDGTYFQASFGHLDGYSAIYYTYMWSLVIAKDLFSVFKQEGLLNPEPARRYRRAVLEAGGTRPAAELVADFLGRSYQFDAYQAWLDGA
jgi:thimet oligopeptidase